MTANWISELATRVDEAFFLIGAAILLIEIAEALFKRDHVGKTFLEMLVSASTQIPYLLVETLILTFGYAMYYVIDETMVPWSLPMTWWAVVAVLILADITYYWEHRIAHEVRLLWTQHAVHHSSRDYNMVTGVRFGPLEGVWSLSRPSSADLRGLCAGTCVFWCNRRAGLSDVAAYRADWQAGTVGMGAEYAVASPRTSWV